MNSKVPQTDYGKEIFRLSIIAFACSVLALFGSIASGRVSPHLFFTADELGLLTQLNGLINGVPFTSLLVPEGVFLPDYIMLLLLRTVFGNDTTLIVYGFAFLLIVFSTAGWLLLAREVFGKNQRQTDSFTFLFCACALLCIAYYPNPFRIALHIAMHSTAFAIMPFALIFLLRALSAKPSRGTFAVLFLLPVFVSDRVFIVWFIIPAIATACISAAIYGKNAAANGAKASLCLIGGTLAVLAFTKFYPFILVSYWPQSAITEPDVYTRLLGACYIFYKWIVYQLVKIYSGLSAIWICWTVAAAFLAALLRKPKARLSLVFLFICSVSQIPLLIAALRVDMIVGMAESHLAIRYFIPSVFIPLFFGWIFVFGAMKNIAKSFLGFLTAALLAVVILVSLPRMYGMAQAKNLASYYPPTVKCFDETARRFNLKSGIAYYWFADYLSALSERKPSVVAVDLPKGGGIHRAGLFHHPKLPELKKQRFDFFIAHNTERPPGQDPCLGMIGSQRCDAGYYTNPFHGQAAKRLIKLSGATPAARIFCGENEILVFNPPASPF